MTEAVQIHPTAVVDDGALVGSGARIWHFCHVMPAAEIGPGCVLGQNVFVGRGVRVGAGTKIQNNVSVYEGVTLEDEVFCGPSMVFTNDLNPRAAFPKGRARFVKTRVKRGCSIGANATVVCGLTLGAYAFVGAGAVVTEDVPDFGVVYGVPARLKDWICVCGELLAFEGERACCSACNRRYVRTGSAGIVLANESR